MKSNTFRKYQQWHFAMMDQGDCPGTIWDAPGKKAPVLTSKQVGQVERFIVRHSQIPAADLLKFRLTIYGGLRVAEVAGLSIFDLVNKDGTISSKISVRTNVGKGGKSREIPMHAKVTEAVGMFLLEHPGSPCIALSKKGRFTRRQSVTALTNYLSRLYENAGLPFHSSHSGRRTFITNLARKIGKQFTLRDVQILAGHARLETTETYIEPSGNIHDLVGRLK